MTINGDSQKPVTALFIDYEHWFYSLLRLGSLGQIWKS